MFLPCNLDEFSRLKEDIPEELIAAHVEKAKQELQITGEEESVKEEKLPKEDEKKTEDEKKETKTEEGASEGLSTDTCVNLFVKSCPILA